MHYVGIDVAKSFHIATVIDEQEKRVLKSFRIDSDNDSFNEFALKLKKISDDKTSFIIGMEATGVYFENLLEFFKEDGYNCILLNPWQTSRYREMVNLNHVKTDEVDAFVIASLLHSKKFSSGYVTDETYQSFRTLNRNRVSLDVEIKRVKKQIKTLLSVVFPEFESVIKNPFSVTGMTLLEKYPTAKHYNYSSSDRVVKLFRHIKGNNLSTDKAEKLLFLAKLSIYSGKAKESRAITMKSYIRLLRTFISEKEIIDSEIVNLLNSPHFTKDDKKEENLDSIQELIANLKTIPGIGNITIASILSECGDLRRFPTAKNFIGYIGIYPVSNESGDSRKKRRLAKKGSPIAKKALYMAAVGSLRHNDELTALYKNKRSQNKSKKESVVIVARKLATIIYSIFVHNTPYNPACVFTGPIKQ